MEEKIKEKLKELVKPKRYEHSLLVANEAKKLAEIFNESEEKAYLTGLAHDIAKNFDYEENKKWIKKYGLDEKWLKKENEKLVHAEVGALVAKEYFNFDDEMCRAIKYHTIGNETMTNFEKIIFLADKIGRKELDEDTIKIKDMAYKDIDKAMLLFLTYQEKKFTTKGKELHPETKKLVKKLEIAIKFTQKKSN